jgi:AraC family transcriptional regulator, regulatory protein of adaptative response / methylated-DNA-[protein]-cysteine methyltransferase
MSATHPPRPAADATLCDPRWQSVLARDTAADGAFFYSVSTTGVYCRPSCGARQPRPENVRFHASAEAAVAAGFRACRRCKPDQPGQQAQHAAMVAAACRLIESAEQPLSLDVLAAQVGASSWHFHRKPTVMRTAPTACAANWCAATR